MNKTTFYFIIVVLVLVDIIQGKYQKNIIKRKEEQAKTINESAKQ